MRSVLAALVLGGLILLVAPVHASFPTLDNVSYEEGKGIFVNGVLYDKGAELFEAYTSPFTSSTPSYQIVPVLNKKVINAGEDLNISFQIVGGGKVESNSILIYFPSGFLSSRNEAHFYSFLGQGTKGNKTFAIWHGDKPEEKTASREGTIISLVPVAFMEVFPDDRTIFGESTMNGHSPLVFEAFSNEDVAPGDHTIRVAFQYSDGSNWYSSQQEVTIHVREWYEKKGYQAVIGVFVGLMIVIGELVIKELTKG